MKMNKSVVLCGGLFLCKFSSGWLCQPKLLRVSVFIYKKLLIKEEGYEQKNNQWETASTGH